MSDSDDERDEGQLLGHEVLEKELDLDEVVVRIECENGETLDVSRRAKQSMTLAIEVNANQPTLYFRNLHCIHSVCNVLGYELLDYSFSMTQEDFQTIDWNVVVPGEKETYPTGPGPSKEDYEAVRVVYQHVKEEKDALWKQHGCPKSNVQAYSTYRGRWSWWRQSCSIYQACNPNMQPQTLLDLMQSELKLCTSQPAVEEKWKAAIQRRIRQLKKEAKKRQVEQELVTIAEEEITDVANEEAEAIERCQNELGGTRNRKAKATRSIMAPVQKKKVAAQNKRKDIQEQKKSLEDKKRALEIEKAMVDYVPPKKKCTVRKDGTRLEEEPTPRSIVERDGESWSPPTRVGQRLQFSKPGDDWLASRTETLRLFLTLGDHLRSDGILEQPMTFNLVMEFLSVDQQEQSYGFFERVFIHLIGIVLSEEL